MWKRKTGIRLGRIENNDFTSEKHKFSKIQGCVKDPYRTLKYLMLLLLYFCFCCILFITIIILITLIILIILFILIVFLILIIIVIIMCRIPHTGTMAVVSALICSMHFVMCNLRLTTSHTPLIPWKSFKSCLTFTIMEWLADAARPSTHARVPASHS